MMETILEVPEMGFETTQKIIQQQLVLILHAHGCQQQEFCYSINYHDDLIPTNIKAPITKCKLPFCEETKKSLDHVRGCFDPENCPVTHCSSTRGIIRHWKTCMKKASCTICRPVFHAQVKNLKNRTHS